MIYGFGTDWLWSMAPHGTSCLRKHLFSLQTSCILLAWHYSVNTFVTRIPCDDFSALIIWPRPRYFSLKVTFQSIPFSTNPHFNAWFHSVCIIFWTVHESQKGRKMTLVSCQFSPQTSIYTRASSLYLGQEESVVFPKWFHWICWIQWQKYLPLQ